MEDFTDEQWQVIFTALEFAERKYFTDRAWFVLNELLIEIAKKSCVG
jgi:hypothetical protein